MGTVAVETVDRSKFKRYFSTADNCVAQVRRALASDSIGKPQAGILYKLAAEIKLWGADYKAAQVLFHESLQLFQAESSNMKVTDSGVSHIRHMISVCEECMQQEPPLLVPIACKEYKLLRPP